MLCTGLKVYKNPVRCPNIPIVREYHPSGALWWTERVQCPLCSFYLIKKADNFAIAQPGDHLKK